MQETNVSQHLLLQPAGVWGRGVGVSCGPSTAEHAHKSFNGQIKFLDTCLVLDDQPATGAQALWKAALTTYEQYQGTLRLKQ